MDVAEEPKNGTPGSGITEPDEKPLPPPGVATQIEIFMKGVDSLFVSFPLTMWIVDAAKRGANDELRRFIKSKCQNVVVQGGSTKGDLPRENYNEYLGIRRKLDRTETATKQISRSFVVSLVSQYDSFVGALVRVLFFLKPELIHASDRTMSFKELSTFSSLDEAKEFIVDKEVETLIRKSHIEQFDWLESKFGLPLRKDLAAWPRFVEVTERRNLIVHCDCRVSSQYLAVCKSNGVNCAEAKLGSELPVSRKYFTDAYECILEVAVKLGQVLWRKVLPNEMEVADANLNQVTLELLSLGRYRAARELLDFAACVLKKWASDADRKIHIINRAQAYKWLGEEDACRNILDAEDWSAVQGKFSLGVAVLRDDFDGAAHWMRTIGSKDTQLEEGYRDWPIFKEFRKSEQFRVAYKELFGRDFSGLPENLHDIPIMLPVPEEKNTRRELPSKDQLDDAADAVST